MSGSVGGSTSKVTPYGPAIAPLNTALKGASHAYKRVTRTSGNIKNPTGNLWHQMYRGKGMVNRRFYKPAKKLMKQAMPMLMRNQANIESNLGAMARGDERGNNPFLDALRTRISDEVRNSVGGQFAAAGREMGSNAYGARAMARGLAEGMAPAEFENYQRDIANMMAANQGLAGNAQGTAGQASGLSNAWGTLGENQNNTALNRFNAGMAALGVPFMPAQSLSNIALPIGQAFPTTTTSSWSAGFGMSDRRMKEDIEPVGETYDGQIIYRFRYVGSPEYRIGLMADEVKERKPEAVHNFAGVDYVDYREALDDAVIEGAF